MKINRKSGNVNNLPVCEFAVFIYILLLLDIGGFERGRGSGGASLLAWAIFKQVAFSCIKRI